jgi:hypothetical protein
MSFTVSGAIDLPLRRKNMLPFRLGLLKNEPRMPKSEWHQAFPHKSDPMKYRLRNRAFCHHICSID